LRVGPDDSVGTIVAKKKRRGQAPRRHPEWTAESCFLPDLTRFTGSRRAGPGRGREQGSGLL
jgi:hypothetical protein